MSDLFGSELNGPDRSDEPAEADEFNALAGAAIRRSEIWTSDLFKGTRVEQIGVGRLQSEVADYMRKAYRWGQTGVHPRDQR